MNRQFASLVLASAVVTLSACGGASESASPELFSVAQGGGGLGPLVGFDGGSGRVSFRLPAGIASADGRLFYVAKPGLNTTTVRRYDRRTGALLGKQTVEGGWTLGGVSATGRFLALDAPGTKRSRIMLFDTASARARIVTLAGRFDAETVAPDGRAIFLIQWLGPARYSVRYYDLVRSRLHTATLRMKGYEEPIMIGSPAASVATADGRWLLTLYLNTAHGKAFVHALNLVERQAICIVLPGEGSGLGVLRSYALAANRDGSQIYAANPALGVIAEVDLAQRGVRAQVEMATSPGPAAASAVSRSGRVLYVAAGSRLWAYDTSLLTLRSSYDARGRVTDLGFGRSGKTVYAVRGDGRALPFAAADKLDA